LGIGGAQPGATSVPPNPSLASPTFAPTASAGDFDLLSMLSTFPTAKITWNKDWFGPAVDNTWQLGSPTSKPNTPPLVVRLGPEVLTPLLGVDAAKRLTRVDATLELSAYDKSALPGGLVFYGFGLESSQGPRISVQAVLVQTSIADLGTNQNGQYRRKTEIPVTTLKTNITIQRNADNTLTLSVDGQPIGQSNASYAKGTPLGIYMYTSASGIVVKVIAIKVHLE
jgi:hypothetical protein